MKVFILIFTVYLVLSAEDISFKEAPSLKKRMLPMQNNILLSYHEVLKETRDSIVHITTFQTTKKKIEVEIFLNDFFPSETSSINSIESKTTGSGVIIVKDGYIVTSKHLMADVDKIVVKLQNSSKVYEARLIGVDIKMDIAVVKIDTKEKLVPIMLGDSSSTKTGDIVFAIGNPFGKGQSVSQGIISAKYKNYIQTDAAMNPGNSGGALVDSRGALIGINSLILSSNGINNGLGFSIKIDKVRDIVKKIITKKN